MSEISSEKNMIQRVAELTHDVLTPANVISAAGLALSIYGTTHIGDTSGVIEYGAGRVLDLIDGPVARRTYPGSSLGAKIDASADKVAMAILLAEAWHQQAVPESVLAVVALFNVINAATNVYADRNGAEPKTSKAGKYGMFTQNAAIGGLLLGHATSSHAWNAVGWGSFAATLPISAKASYDYTKHALSARKTPKQHSRRRR